MICGGPGISDAYYCKECTVQVINRVLSQRWKTPGNPRASQSGQRESNSGQSGTPADREDLTAAREHLKATRGSLASFRCSPAAVRLSQVPRFPGFFHLCVTEYSSSNNDDERGYMR